ncbi:hypothetical protein LOCC1_G001484 [Lachnellula occidentalis]|uniref:Aminoglycoside phosphotransferase domain-containing protein n=1 Tax=Lachnellula occidentalis TaxID=215460 RepID=A0A8H8S8P9_9HELO|nr:hypothetical protein LOCC1_G001484 [Lachnellula occidentalis]
MDPRNYVPFIERLVYNEKADSVANPEPILIDWIMKRLAQCNSKVRQALCIHLSKVLSTRMRAGHKITDKRGIQDAETSTPTDPFFTRNKLTHEDQQECYAIVSQLYPNQTISPASCQGYCSFTLFVGPSTVIQFRPSPYRLDPLITSLASSIHSTHVPQTSHRAVLRSSGLDVYTMSRIPGTSLRDSRSHSPVLARSPQFLENLCTSLAAFLAHSWHGPLPPTPLGTIGTSLYARLQLLATALPARFRPTARQLLDNIDSITALPWVLTHGDLVPGNIMLAPSGHLTGLVDWAEAEVLPFGLCLYGLEEILGEMTERGWEYHAAAEGLRALFWRELCTGIGEKERMSVEMARIAGILLWWGFSWDEGRIDRVVEEGRDGVEIARLDAFLGSFEEGDVRVFKL